MDDDGAVRAGTRLDAVFSCVYARLRAGTVRGISKIAVVVGQDPDGGK